MKKKVIIKTVVADVHYSFLDDNFSANIHADDCPHCLNPDDRSYRGRLLGTTYQGGYDFTDWSQRFSVPADITVEEQENYIRNNYYPESYR